MLNTIKAALFLFWIAICAVAFVFYLGFGIEALKPMPPYAYLYVDDKSQKYAALPCVLISPQAVEDDLGAWLRLTQLSEVRKLKYKPDTRCRDSGAFMQPARSPSGRFLEWIGVLGPIEYWWDQPFRIENGTVIHPKEGA